MKKKKKIHGTCFELHSWKLHKEELLLSLLPALWVHLLLHVLLLIPIKVKLLVQETLPDLLHLLAVPVLLAHLLQYGQSLCQFGPAVPCVAVLGRTAHHVKTLQHIHDVVDASAFYICGERQKTYYTNCLRLMHDECNG